MPKQVPIEYLRERLTYDPDTGELRWKFTPEFNKVRNLRFAGKIAGCTDNKGYIVINFTYQGKMLAFRAHRIAFAITYGYWPTSEIDHCNRIKSDNRIVNLREATHTQNQHNRDRLTNNTSGYPGVYRFKTRWRAQISQDGRRVYLGSYPTKETAAHAYVSAKRQYHTFTGGQHSIS